VTDRPQTDRQTDHATEKCVAIGEIAFSDAISPEKVVYELTCLRKKLTTLLKIILS